MSQFIVNAFENGPFTGNPAAVVPLESWLPDATLQAIAAQNNLSETAFFTGSDPIALRWYTPACEIELCGHATLASAHVLRAELGDSRPEFRFATASGELVARPVKGGYTLRLPARAPAEEVVTDGVRLAVCAALSVPERSVLTTGSDFIVVLDSAEDVAQAVPDLDLVRALPGQMLVVTAPGIDHDVCSRVFAPQVGIDEDPVTGAAHAALIPYWSTRLGKGVVSCFQASERGGVLRGHWVREEGRVELVGSCRTFMCGAIEF